ncbi:MAG TPA: LysR family transcriptional regulator, partial [Firmicutes bacterium]|nr:LysR family transcriptional regulator [Bacillota bacterium]
LATLQHVNLETLLKQRLIIREQGSGSRDILEKLLANLNESIEIFPNVMEIGQIKAIKELVKENLGITFIYKSGIKDELKSGELVIVEVEDFKLEREFNFVYLNSTMHEAEYLAFYQFVKETLEDM